MQVIFETGGKQYTADKGTQLYIEKLDAAADSAVTFDKVLAIIGDKESVFGAPYVTGASVAAKVLKNGKSKKITVFTYRSKKDSKRKMGHRQPYTKVEILDVTMPGKKAAKPAAAEKPADEVKAAEKPAEKKAAAPKAAAEKKAAAPKATAEKKATAPKATAEKKAAAPKAAAEKKAAAPKATAEKKPAAPKKTAAKKTEKES